MSVLVKTFDELKDWKEQVQFILTANVIDKLKNVEDCSNITRIFSKNVNAYDWNVQPDAHGQDKLTTTVFGWVLVDRLIVLDFNWQVGYIMAI